MLPLRPTVISNIPIVRPIICRGDANIPYGGGAVILGDGINN